MRESNTPTSSLREFSVNTASISIDVAVQHSTRVDKQFLAELVRKILTDHDIGTAEISIAVVDDATIRRLNREYLNHDYETDVLSFVLDRNLEQGILAGEIIVSADTAQTVADRQGIAFRDELALYVIHGALHLVGCDDRNSTSRSMMRQAEFLYTEHFGIQYSNPDGDDSGKEAI